MGPAARAEALVDDGRGSRVEYLAGFLGPAEQAALFEALRSGAPWGREADACGPQQRLSCYLGDPGCVFWYVGLRLEPRPWGCGLEPLRRRLAEALGCPPLTACLLNNYEAGTGYIAPHSDEVRVHGPEKVVASVSLGGSRRFLLRARGGGIAEGEEGVDRVLEPGSVLVMRGETQTFWEHVLRAAAGRPGPAPHLPHLPVHCAGLRGRAGRSGRLRRAGLPSASRDSAALRRRRAAGTSHTVQ